MVILFIFGYQVPCVACEIVFGSVLNLSNYGHFFVYFVYSAIFSTYKCRPGSPRHTVESIKITNPVQARQSSSLS